MPPGSAAWSTGTSPTSTRSFRAGGIAIAPGTTQNTEHVFGLEVPPTVDVVLDPREHLRHAWLPWKEAAAKCFSWSNRDAILLLPKRRPQNPGH